MSVQSPTASSSTSTSTPRVSARTCASKYTPRSEYSRAQKAARESMSTHLDGDGLVTVYSGDSEYTVYMFGYSDDWKCTCADHRHRFRQCKHIERSKMALGLHDIPDGLLSIDPTLRQRRAKLGLSSESDPRTEVQG